MKCWIKYTLQNIELQPIHLESNDCEIFIMLTLISHGNAIVGLIKKLKRYFPKSATNEILEEFRPIMCFHDHLLFKAQGFLCLFLPTNTGTIEWLDEIMTYWSGIGMYPTYDQGFISLLASAAEDCAGNINWEPYLPLIFTKILICLGNFNENLNLTPIKMYQLEILLQIFMMNIQLKNVKCLVPLNMQRYIILKKKINYYRLC